MFADCRTIPAVIAQQEQSGLRFELISVPRVCVDDNDPDDIYEQAATLRITNISETNKSLVFEGGNASHLAFGVAEYSPAKMPERVDRISFGPLDPQKRREGQLHLRPGESGVITGRRSYILRIIDTARRDMATLGQQEGDSASVDYRVTYAYRVRDTEGQMVEGGFSQPLSIWIRR